MDLIYYWMGERPATAVQSVGALQHFTAAARPAGAASRCLDCPFEPDCAYSARKIYLANPGRHWPNSVVCDIEEDQSRYS